MPRGSQSWYPAGPKPPTARWRRAGWWALVLSGVVLSALMLAGAVLLMPGGPGTSIRAASDRNRIVIPPRPIPPPAEFLPVARETARAINAKIPISTATNPAALPFRLGTAGEDRERAIDCLAAALYYEVGTDEAGQAAVAQVVLNRVRHPAFPKTLCGVVFEGADRRTGCQFTFTCDGALTRYRPGPAAWARARVVAIRALNGAVFAPVGLATHYHTDWVVPYWSSAFDKVAKVDTHLFFRWRGTWGTPRAFLGRVEPVEPVMTQIAGVSAAHADAALPPMVATIGVKATAGPGPPAGDEDPPLAAIPGQPSVFLLTLSMESAARYPALASKACGQKRSCRFLVWTDRAQQPADLPLSQSQAANTAFSYVRDQNSGFERTTWNCRIFPEYRPCSPTSTVARPLPDLSEQMAPTTSK